MYRINYINAKPWLIRDKIELRYVQKRLEANSLRHSARPQTRRARPANTKCAAHACMALLYFFSRAPNIRIGIRRRCMVCKIEVVHRWNHSSVLRCIQRIPDGPTVVIYRYYYPHNHHHLGNLLHSDLQVAPTRGLLLSHRKFGSFRRNISS